jgi:hypothetical protein
MEDFSMPKIRTINGIPNIPSCSTIVTLKTSDITPVTNFRTTVKINKNIEVTSIGIRSLLKSSIL